MAKKKPTKSKCSDKCDEVALLKFHIKKRVDKDYSEKAFGILYKDLIRISVKHRKVLEYFKKIEILL